MLAVTGAALFHDSVPDSFGQVQQAQVRNAQDQQTQDPKALNPQSQPSRAPDRQPPSRPPAPRPVSAPQLPTHLSIPSLDADAPVVPTAVSRDHRLLLPDPSRLGWWAGGATPGANSGTTVLAGHVDTPDGDQGALYALSAIRPDAKVLVRTPAGVRTYRVIALRTYPRRHLPPEVFRRDGPHRLVLITCGGTYSPTTGYERNVVAYATPDR
jgi:sortase (surface protein transpeptidase)